MSKNDARTIILAEDGRFVTLGRHSSPTEEEIAEASAVMAANEIGGWLATMDRGFYGARCPKLVMIRQVSPTRSSWDDAERAFRFLHKNSAPR